MFGNDFVSQFAVTNRLIVYNITCVKMSLGVILI